MLTRACLMGAGLLALAAAWVPGAADAAPIPSSATNANGVALPVHPEAITDASGNQICITGNPCVVTGALVAGSAVVGKVGIDQTTPGTTNGVQVLTGSTTTVTQAAAANLNATVIGPTADGSAASTAPVLTAGTTDGTATGSVAIPKITAAGVATASIDQTTPGATNGVQTLTGSTTAVTGTVNVVGTQANATATGTSGVLVMGQVGGTARFLPVDNNGLYVQGSPGFPVYTEETGYSFSHISTGATTTVKSGAWFMHSINVNTCVSGATATIYANTAGSGTVVAVITCPASTAGLPPFIYDIQGTTGLTVVTSGATDVTVSYR